MKKVFRNVFILEGKRSLGKPINHLRKTLLCEDYKRTGRTGDVTRSVTYQITSIPVTFSTDICKAFHMETQDIMNDLKSGV